MKAFIALIQREFLEHRGAFFTAPLAITAGLMAITIMPWLSGRLESEMEGTIGGAKLYEFAYLLAGAIWLGYLLVALVFYHADAFWADRRNNALLFWKSMPQTDFKILLSKLTTGLTVFPALILGVVAFAGLWLYIVLLTVGSMTPLMPPSPAEALSAFVNATLIIAVLTVLTLLWYLPFMAWIGALSTAIGRWSLPVAVLIPALVILTENAIGMRGAPPGGYVWAYLSHRLSIDAGQAPFERYILGQMPLDAGAIIGQVLMNMDWFSMISGWVFALIAIYAASAYRRRGTES